MTQLVLRTESAAAKQCLHRLKEKIVVFCRVAIRCKLCSNLHDGALSCYWMCQIIGQKSRWGVVSLLFHLMTPGAQRLAKWLSRMRREDVIACRGWRLCSEHVDEDCIEARSLLRREFARGDGSYMRMPGRTSKVTAIPTRFAHIHVHSLWRCSPIVSLAEAKKSASMRRYLFVRTWPS